MKRFKQVISESYKTGSNGNLPKLHHDQTLYFDVNLEPSGEHMDWKISYYATNAQKKKDIDVMLARDAAEKFGKKVESVWIDHSKREIFITPA